MILYMMPDHSLRLASPASQDGPALHQMRSIEVHPEPPPAFRKLRSLRSEGTRYIDLLHGRSILYLWDSHHARSRIEISSCALAQRSSCAAKRRSYRVLRDTSDGRNSTLRRLAPQEKELCQAGLFRQATRFRHSGTDTTICGHHTSPAGTSPIRTTPPKRPPSELLALLTHWRRCRGAHLEARHPTAAA